MLEYLNLEEEHESDKCDDFPGRKVYSKAFVIITQFFWISIKFLIFWFTLCFYAVQNNWKHAKTAKITVHARFLIIVWH